MMKRRAIAQDLQEVSALCLGTLNFGAGLEPAACNAMLDLFASKGGNFVDTAHVYSNWLEGEKSRSEKILGRWLEHRDRKSVVIATKGGHFDFSAPQISRVVPSEIVRDIRESLEYLRTDYIDLFFLHRDNEALPVSALMDCLNEQIHAGTIRQIGCSNWRLPRLREAQAYAAAKGLRPFVCNQLMWSMAKINPAAIPADYTYMDQAFYQYHKAHALPAMCYTSQAKGYFARRLAGESLPESVTEVYGNSRNDRIYEQLLTASASTGKSLTELALQYFSLQPFPAFPIVSCDTQKQLLECMDAFMDGVSTDGVLKMEDELS